MAKKNKNIILVLIATMGAYLFLNKKTTTPTNTGTGSGAGTTPAPTTNALGYNFNNTNNIVQDKNGFVVADGVAKFDNSTSIITYNNNWTLDLVKGILKNDTGVQLTQNFNSKKLPTYKNEFFKLPVKVYGYLLLSSTFIYIENDKTPYYLEDSSWFNYGEVVNLFPATNTEYYTNIKGYMYPNNITEGGLLFYKQSQFNYQNTEIIYSINNGYRYNFNWQGVLYLRQNNSMNLIGTGVTQIDLINNTAFFDDGNFLDFNKNILYNSSGNVVKTNIKTYASYNSWTTGVAGYIDQNGNLQNLPSTDQYNLTPNSSTMAHYNIF